MKTTSVVLIFVVAVAALVGVWLFLSGTPVGESFLPANQGGENPPNSAEGAPPGSIHNLPLPPAVAAAKARAAADANTTEDKIFIETAYEREWPDGCLGLAGAGEFCTQALVPGWEVTVMVGGETRVYRTNIDGTVIRRAS